MGGKAVPKRVVQLRGKRAGDATVAAKPRQRAASPRGTGPRTRLSGENTNKNRQLRRLQQSGYNVKHPNHMVVRPPDQHDDYDSNFIMLRQNPV